MSWAREAGFEPASFLMDSEWLYQLSYSRTVQDMKPITIIKRVTST